MRYIFLSLCAALFGAILVTGCNSTAKTSGSAGGGVTPPQGASQPQTETAYADGARRITIADANKLIKSGQALVLDVRNQQSYDAGHIPGARLIPSGEILNHVNELPRDKTIITYCS